MFLEVQTFGIKTNSNEYYVLDFANMPQDNPDIQIGDSFTASGVIVPLEMLSTDQWKKYNVKGIFSVTDSVQKFLTKSENALWVNKIYFYHF